MALLIKARPLFNQTTFPSRVSTVGIKVVFANN
jgi:hypothetical protein